MKPKELPDQVTLRCCGCHGEVTFVVPKKDGSDRPTMFHTMPYCARFDETNTAAAVVQYFRDCGDAGKRN